MCGDISGRYMGNEGVVKQSEIEATDLAFGETQKIKTVGIDLKSNKENIQREDMKVNDKI